MRSVADAIVHHLADAGVTAIFGVPGGGSNLDLIAAAGRAGLRFVLTATETAGASAARAPAATTRRPRAPQSRDHRPPRRLSQHAGPWRRFDRERCRLRLTRTCADHRVHRRAA